MSPQLSNAAPYEVKPRRTILACSICRKRKLRPPRNPCERCVRKNLPCEYIAVSIAQELIYHPVVNAPHTHSSYGQFQPQPSQHQHQLPFYPYSPQYAHPYPTPHGYTGYPMPRAPPLPYTAPPPAGSRPRYYGQQLPPLSDDCLPVPVGLPPPPTPPLCDFAFVPDAELELENIFYCYDDSDRSSQSSPYSLSSSSSSQSPPTYQYRGKPPSGPDPPPDSCCSEALMGPNFYWVIANVIGSPDVNFWIETNHNHRGTVDLLCVLQISQITQSTKFI
ncbi:hypothetical protein FB45DRAFT_863273 [Roridomyces roridus]|uniref:Zn(2)-C6 fungal-type domain-containing protein n=1 Tax=Roridomyces roridus TaxID=1738132 RepID=A0AAD7CB83_9AGAR|nr:hypothetical protein FB45DRAFT_863273 [Roridomyces roridus]